jgi:hypothetical protein
MNEIVLPAHGQEHVQNALDLIDDDRSAPQGGDDLRHGEAFVHG